MYRGLTWWVLEGGIEPGDRVGVLASLATFDLVVSTDPHRLSVVVGSTDVTTAIRQADVTAAVSAVSAIPEVRHELVARQRAIIGSGGIVVEGRDIGTVVCPVASVKIFLTAAAEVRASRRALEARSPGSSVLDVKADLDRRDRLDSRRQTSPLTQAADAYSLDSSAMTATEVVAAVLDVVREKTGVIPSQSLDSISGERL
jgi:cytidylate kinase